MKKQLDFISIMSELGAGTRGASLGLQAMKVADWTKGGSFFADKHFTEVPTDNDFIYENTDTPTALNIEGIAKLFPNIRNAVCNSLESGKFPVIISGDHSSAAACLQGTAKALKGKKLGVIWIDAHADLHSPYTTPSGNVHGMPLAIAGHEENLPAKINELKPKTLKLWEELKGEEPAFTADSLVFTGVRDTEKPEEVLLERLHIPNYTVTKTRELGIAKAAEAMLDHLSHCDAIYVSFDVDSMDCNEISMGTGTPVPNGFTEAECTEMIAHFLRSPKIAAFEIVEINPTLDNKGNKMAETALRILEKSCQVLSE